MLFFTRNTIHTRNIRNNNSNKYELKIKKNV